MRLALTPTDIALLSEKLLLTNADLDARMGQCKRQRIQTVNLQHLHLASREERFRKTLFEADFITADGWPVAALFRAYGLCSGRVTGSDFVERILRSSSVKSTRLGRIGTGPTAGDRFATLLEESGIPLVFRDHGAAIEWDPVEITQGLHASGANVLLVAVSAPIGEYVAQDIKDAGYIGSIICVGAAIGMAAGGEPRAPLIMRRFGLEWLRRLLNDPRRLWRRYLFDGMGHFLTVILPLIIRLRYLNASNNRSREA
jgi:N-acetylglucosaminyldiphosphoundecaprenol N-acetyl-beta-D-mannosaminyltransferase